MLVEASTRSADSVDEYDFSADNFNADSFNAGWFNADWASLTDRNSTARAVLLGYLLLGVVQVAIVAFGADYRGAARWVTAAELALFFTCLPLVATIVGMFRAVAVWQWSFWRATSVFLGPFVLLLAVVAYSELSRAGA